LQNLESHTGVVSTGRHASKPANLRIAAFPYRGGKFHLAPKLIKLLPPHKVYVEVFGGAGSVLLAKPRSRIEVYNDNNGQLVNLFETIRNHPVRFLRRCRYLLYSRELYYAWKNQLAKNFKGIDIDRIEAAIRTAYSITSSFTGDPTRGWAFDRSGSGGGSNRWANIAQKVSFVNERLQRVDIDHLDFRDCIKNWDGPQTLFFLDPPYYSGESGFYYFTQKDHRDLRAILGKVKAKWLLTYDDTRFIRKLYKGFNISRISSSLSSEKVKRGAKRVRFRQLVITNFSSTA
jgi:DNA adenine methylase